MMGGRIAQGGPDGNGAPPAAETRTAPLRAGPLQIQSGPSGQTNWTVTIS